MVKLNVVEGILAETVVVYFAVHAEICLELNTFNRVQFFLRI